MGVLLGSAANKVKGSPKHPGNPRCEESLIAHYSFVKVYTTGLDWISLI
jgi:hypothetical protein